jgi:hypothetical protein
VGAGVTSVIVAATATALLSLFTSIFGMPCQAQNSGVLLIFKTIPDKGSIFMLELMLESRFALVLVTAIFFLIVVLLLIGSFLVLFFGNPLAFCSFLVRVAKKFNDGLLIGLLL